jgi:hypothetical protein
MGQNVANKGQVEGVNKAPSDIDKECHLHLSAETNNTMAGGNNQSKRGLIH